MNYFAHGVRFLDRPYYLAGTAIPDWLSVADRGVRMRSRRVAPFADGSGSPLAELAAGVLQHLHDDGWFHRTRAFTEVTDELTQLFRNLLSADEGFRPSFLGHIVTELILDGTLIAQNRSGLQAYYDALNGIEPDVVQSAVNQMAREPTLRLADFIPLFHREQFLLDYLEPESLLLRLNQVLRRIKLNPLPAEAKAVLVAAWKIVDRRADELLCKPDLLTDPPEG
jgi:hypothetical protein